jgi:hypothetical protein
MAIIAIWTLVKDKKKNNDDYSFYELYGKDMYNVKGG